MANRMMSRYTPNIASVPGRVLVWLTMLMAMAAWCIMLVTLSILQHDCDNKPDMNPQVVYGLPPNSCGKYFRYQWFIIMLDIFVLFVVFVFSATNVVHIHRVALCALLAVVTVLLMDMTNTFNYTRNVTQGSLSHKFTSMFVGSLLSAACNGLLIFVLGSHDETALVGDGVHHTGTGHTGGGMFGHGHKNAAPVGTAPAGTTTTTGATV